MKMKYGWLGLLGACLCLTADAGHFNRLTSGETGRIRGVLSRPVTLPVLTVAIYSNRNYQALSCDNQSDFVKSFIAGTTDLQFEQDGLGSGERRYFALQVWPVGGTPFCVKDPSDVSVTRTLSCSTRYEILETQFHPQPSNDRRGLVTIAEDLDGDGTTDFVMTNTSGMFGHLDAYLGGSSQPSWSFATQTGHIVGVGMVSVSDMNGDGVRDIVVDDIDSLGVQDRLRILDGQSGAEISQLLAFPYNRTFGWSMKNIGDSNLDGKDELLVSDPQVDEIYKVDLGTGQISIFHQNISGGLIGEFISVGDVDGNGVLDVAMTVENPSGIRVLNGADGSPMFQDYSGGGMVALGDVNGDGKADIASGTRYTHLAYVRLWDGASGNLIREFDANQEGVDFLGQSLLMNSDLNGDGVNDLVMSGLDGVMVYSAVEDWVMAKEVRSNGFGAFVTSAGDVNQNGRDEIFVFDNSSPVSYVLELRCNDQ